MFFDKLGGTLDTCKSRYYLTKPLSFIKAPVVKAPIVKAPARSQTHSRVCH